jgi:hypothetical protein
MSKLFEINREEEDEKSGEKISSPISESGGELSFQ